MGKDGGFHPFKGRVSKHFGDSVRTSFSIYFFGFLAFWLLVLVWFGIGLGQRARQEGML